jgi:hypothetical protein
MHGRWNLPAILVVLLMLSILPSCATTQQEGGSAPDKPRAGVAVPPKEGDIKMVDGVEYVYGRNVRWLSVEGEPEYIWVRKDQYAGRLSDSLSQALSRRADDAKEIEDLRKRLDRLEADMKKADGTSGGRETR